jgi:hypothetical protein
MLGIIKINFKYLTMDIFVLLYKSMVRSHIDYNKSVWALIVKKIVKDWREFKRELLN